MIKASSVASPTVWPKSTTISDLYQIYLSTDNVVDNNENDRQLKIPFSVKWMPNINGFYNFVEKYREITSIRLGGTRKHQYQYTERTINEVLSVSNADDRSSLPQRISLSNFHLGPPITSYGCIFRYAQVGKEPQYLLIRRKDSTSYIELIHGSYRESQLYFMLQDISLEERERLLKYDYQELWEDLHLKPGEGESYEFGLCVFQKIRPHLEELFKQVQPADPLNRNLWLFPKGKINWYGNDEDDWEDASPKRGTGTPEAPFDCAIREFEEETNGLNLLERDAHLAFSDPLIERCLGSNSKNYQTDYFVFNEISSEPPPEPTCFQTVHTGIRELSKGEVQEIKWVYLSELKDYLRQERQELVSYIEKNGSDKCVENVSEYWRHPANFEDLSFENNE